MSECFGFFTHFSPNLIAAATLLLLSFSCFRAVRVISLFLKVEPRIMEKAFLCTFSIALLCSWVNLLKKTGEANSSKLLPYCCQRVRESEVRRYCNPQQLCFINDFKGFPTRKVKPCFRTVQLRETMLTLKFLKAKGLLTYQIDPNGPIWSPMVPFGF